MESIAQMEKRFLNCEKILKSIKGTFINKDTAKEINKLQKGGFRISEARLNDYNSIVVMERQFDNESFGTPYIFIVKGKLGKKLNFS